MNFFSFVEVCKSAVVSFFGIFPFIKLFIFFISSIVVIKILGSMLKNINDEKRLVYSRVPISKKLTRICKKYNFPESSIIITTDKNFYACTFGFFKQRLVFHKALLERLNSRELEAVFLHELYHKKYFHIWYLFFAKIISSMLFFIPVIKDFDNNLNIMLENRADMFAAKTQKTSKYLRKALIIFLKPYKKSAYPMFSLLSQQRIDALLNEQKPTFVISKKRVFASVFIVFVIFVFTDNIQNVKASSVKHHSLKKCDFEVCTIECRRHTLLFENSQ